MFGLVFVVRVPEAPQLLSIRSSIRSFRLKSAHSERIRGLYMSELDPGRRPHLAARRSGAITGLSTDAMSVAVGSNITAATILCQGPEPAPYFAAAAHLGPPFSLRGRRADIDSWLTERRAS